MKNGFTLIELLVVIAIIGMIAAIVLAYLGNVRDRGNDSVVKADLEGIRRQAEIVFDNIGSYNTTGAAITNDTCSTIAIADPPTHIANESNIQLAVDHAALNGGADVTCNVSTSGDSYLIASPLKTGGFWCIDSQSIAKFEAARPLATSFLCP